MEQNPIQQATLNKDATIAQNETIFIYSFILQIDFNLLEFEEIKYVQCFAVFIVNATINGNFILTGMLLPVATCPNPNGSVSWKMKNWLTLRAYENCIQLF